MQQWMISPEVNEYIYCLVKPDNINRDYYYISDIEGILPGDTVAIPFGVDNKETLGTVHSGEKYLEYEVPFPIENTKKILRKVGDVDKQFFSKKPQEETPGENAKKYIYCWVKPEGVLKSYCYISKTKNLKTGDVVIVPFGSKNREVYGTITSIKAVGESDAPYPVHLTKQIICKAFHETKKYEYIIVRPITHKQKTFSYLYTDPDINIGDYVEVEFRDGKRVAQVLNKKTDYIDHAPDNFLPGMNVLRKLNYENCDYIRFMTDLVPLSLTGELYRSETENISIPETLAGFFENDQLKPRLTKKAVETFEKVYRVKLPEEYKSFVTEASNGYGEIPELKVLNYEEEYTLLERPFPFDDLITQAKASGESKNLKYECDSDDCSDCKYKDICPDSEYLDNYGHGDFFIAGWND